MNKLFSVTEVAEAVNRSRMTVYLHLSEMYPDKFKGKGQSARFSVEEVDCACNKYHWRPDGPKSPQQPEAQLTTEKVFAEQKNLGLLRSSPVVVRTLSQVARDLGIAYPTAYSHYKRLFPLRRQPHVLTEEDASALLASLTSVYRPKVHGGPAYDEGGRIDQIVDDMQHRYAEIHKVQEASGAAALNDLRNKYNMLKSQCDWLYTKVLELCHKAYAPDGGYYSPDRSV
jgi:hypothetical protein